MSAATVRAACKEHGVSMPRDQNVALPSTFQILRRLLDGWRQSEVAVEFHVSTQRVGQIVTRAREAGFDV